MQLLEVREMSFVSQQTEILSFALLLFSWFNQSLEFATILVDLENSSCHCMWKHCGCQAK